MLFSPTLPELGAWGYGLYLQYADQRYTDHIGVDEGKKWIDWQLIWDDWQEEKEEETKSSS